jgi:MFS family permease
MLQIRRLRFKAILLGVLADTIGTLIVATALFLALAAAGLPEAEIIVRLRGFSGLMLMLILGLSFTLIGGYVAGRTAGRIEILHGAVVAAIGMVLGLFFREPGLPLWYETVSFAAMIPIGMAGGYIARERNVKRNLPENK